MQPEFEETKINPADVSAVTPIEFEPQINRMAVWVFKVVTTAGEIRCESNQFRIDEIQKRRDNFISLWNNGNIEADKNKLAETQATTDIDIFKIQQG